MPATRRSKRRVAAQSRRRSQMSRTGAYPQAHTLEEPSRSNRDGTATKRRHPLGPPFIFPEGEPIEPTLVPSRDVTLRPGPVTRSMAKILESQRPPAHSTSTDSKVMESVEESEVDGVDGVGLRGEIDERQAEPALVRPFEELSESAAARDLIPEDSSDHQQFIREGSHFSLSIPDDVVINTGERHLSSYSGSSSRFPWIGRPYTMSWVSGGSSCDHGAETSLPERSPSACPSDSETLVGWSGYGDYESGSFSYHRDSTPLEEYHDYGRDCSETNSDDSETVVSWGGRDDF